MRFRVLGSLEAIHDGERVPLSGMRAKALALLLLEQGRWIPAQRFTGFLWDEDPPSTAVRQVQNTIAALRRLLSERGGDPIERSGHGYRLSCDELDLVHFERAVAAAREATRAGDAAAAAEELEHALDQWRGAALADLTGDRLDAASARLERERLAAVEALNEAELATGHSGSVIVRARELLDADPYRQRAAAQYMRALHAQGRGVEALEFYAEIRARLADELGLDPDPELREAQRRILEAEPEPPKPKARQAMVVPAQLPAAVSGFCCREADLAALDGLISTESGATRIAVVSGTAGVGKTSLAVEWSHRVRDRFPDGQLYVNLRGFDPGGSVLDPADALHGFLTGLDVSSSSVPRELEARAALFRSLAADRRMLVVLDNAREAEQVRPLLPGSPSCAVLVTSRRLMPGLAVRHGAAQVRLEVFDRAESRELLRGRLGVERATAEPEAVDRIQDSCAGLPLALAIVAARAASETRSPLRLLADRLHEADSALDAFETDDPLGDVRAVFSWSYEALSPDAARLFRLIGLHPGPHFSAAAAASLAGVPLRRARSLLRELTGAHLLTEHRPDRYAAHDLLAAYARETVEEHEGATECAAAVRRLLGHCTGSAFNASTAIDPFRDKMPMPEPEPDAVVESFEDSDTAMAWVLTELQMLGNMVRYAESTGADDYTTALGWAIAGPLHRNGNWDIGLATQRCVLRAARRLGDRRHEVTAHVYTAMFLFSCAAFDEAETHLRRARDLCDPERDRSLLARINHRFAVVFNEVRRFEEALDHCREALRLFVEAGDDSGQANALNGIGWLHAKLGQFEEALEHCRKSLALSEAIEAHSAQASVLDSIGYILHCQGRNTEAIDHYLRSIDLSRRIGFRSNEGEVQDHLGDLYLVVGEPVPAGEHWRHALAIFEETREFRADQVRAKLAELESADRPKPVP